MIETCTCGHARVHHSANGTEVCASDGCECAAFELFFSARDDEPFRPSPEIERVMRQRDDERKD